MFDTLPGKLFCHVICAALILPWVTVGVAANAAAQITSKKYWAVLPFEDLSGGKFGQVATDAVAKELGGRADEFRPPIAVVEPETVSRTIETLGLVAPLKDDTSISRLGMELKATTVVNGSIAQYRILNVPGGRQAQVIMRVTAINVASMLPINGAAIQANSAVRPSNTSDEKLIQEAVEIGAGQAVGKILSQTLPTGTILNTVSDNALINQGSRAGFRVGQRVIITRNHEQVATGKITDVEFDQASLNIERFTKGVAPGDNVQVIFEVPALNGKFGEGTTPGTKRPASHGNNSALISTALVLALGVFFVMNSQNNSPFGKVIAEAALYPDNSGQPAVKVSWSPDIFAKGLTQRFAFQVWRADLTTSPVIVTNGATTYGYDLQTENPIAIWYNFGGYTGDAPGTPLNTTPPQGGAGVTPTGLTPGKPNTYSVELVFALSQNDLPGSVTSSSGSTGGLSGGGTASGTGTTSTGTGTTSTGGTNGVGGTNGGTTGTNTGSTGTNTGTTAGGTGSTGGGSASTYYFVTQRTYSGLATALNRISLVSPAANAVITAPTPFTFSSVVNSAYPIVAEYVIQFSTDPGFPVGSTYSQVLFQRPDFSTNLSSPTLDTSSAAFPSFITGATTVWWRIGARNVADVPGPVADQLGKRYVYSAPRIFTRPTNTPPGNASRGHRGVGVKNKKKPGN